MSTEKQRSNWEKSWRYRERGYTWTQIARTMGVSDSTVQSYVKKYLALQETIKENKKKFVMPCMKRNK